MDRMEVTIVTDGSCKGNPGPGGWAAILQCGKHVKQIAGFSPATTNNRMELKAVIEGVKALKKPCIITIMTDSQYVAAGIADGREMVARGYRTKSGQKMKNDDLWQELTTVGIAGKHKFQVIKVKGHSGDELNERADSLAKAQIIMAGEEKPETKSIQEIVKDGNL